MKGRRFTGVIALGVMLAATVTFSQTKPATEGPAVGETPAWFLQGSFPDPTGRTIVEPGGKVTVPARGAAWRGEAEPPLPGAQRVRAHAEHDRRRVRPDGGQRCLPVMCRLIVRNAAGLKGRNGDCTATR